MVSIQASIAAAKTAMSRVIPPDVWRDTAALFPVGFTCGAVLEPDDEVEEEVVEALLVLDVKEEVVVVVVVISAEELEIVGNEEDELNPNALPDKVLDGEVVFVGDELDPGGAVTVVLVGPGRLVITKAGLMFPESPRSATM